MFASVITGNLVQLGRAIAAVDGAMVVDAATSVGGYTAEVAAGTVGPRRCAAGRA
jgi:uncharacterized membrane protein YoaK (UPF0700 family)